MSNDRRKFLKVAGFATLAVTGSRALGAANLAPTPWLKGGGLEAKRWAMVIDLKKCHQQEGCTKCMDACHLEHNVPKIEIKKHEIKWIWKESFHHAFHEQEHEHTPESIKHSPIPVLCNHCDNPPCVRVCPTEATFKRESDGIVMMDWHRCIGCRYCVVGCPYGARSFNWEDPREHMDDITENFPTRMKGVVEKCTFCETRLRKGLPPACVEACEYGALTFGDLDDPDSEVRKLLESNYTIRRKPQLGTEPQVYYIV